VVAEDIKNKVAPRAGAWIETCKGETEGRRCWLSRPARARGLKLLIIGYYLYDIRMSRPARARGLKRGIGSGDKSARG
jgi:hypothetical protein